MVCFNVERVKIPTRGGVKGMGEEKGGHRESREKKRFKGGRGEEVRGRRDSRSRPPRRCVMVKEDNVEVYGIVEKLSSNQ